MKNFLLLTVLLINGLAIPSAYAFFADEQPNPQIHKLQEDALSKIDVLGCLNEGGVIKAVCMQRLPACIKGYADANKACADSTECAGECLVEQPYSEAGATVTGTCSVNNNHCGCFQTVKLGVAQQVICVD